MAGGDGRRKREGKAQMKQGIWGETGKGCGEEYGEGRREEEGREQRNILNKKLSLEFQLGFKPWSSKRGHMTIMSQQLTSKP